MTGTRILTNGEYYSSAELFLLKKLLLYADQPKAHICLNDLITLFDKGFYRIFANPLPSANRDSALGRTWFYADVVHSKYRTYNDVLRWLQDIHGKGVVVFTCPRLFEEDFKRIYDKVFELFAEKPASKFRDRKPNNTQRPMTRELMRAQELADRLSGETLREMEAEPDPGKPLGLEFTDKGTKLIKDSLDCYLDWFVDEGYSTVQKAEGKFLYPGKAISILHKVIHNACENYQTQEIDITLNMHFRPENKDQQQPDWFIEPEIRVIETILLLEKQGKLTITKLLPDRVSMKVDTKLLRAAKTPTVGGGIDNFEIPGGLSWKDVSINFEDSQTVTIRIAGQKKNIRTDYKEMGFADNTKKTAPPDKLWEAFNSLPLTEGILDGERLKGNSIKARMWDTKRKTKQKLADKLKAYFKIDDDPFKRIGKRQYQIKIELTAYSGRGR